MREDLGVDVAVLRAARLGAAGGGDPERLYEAEWLRGTATHGHAWRRLDELPSELATALAPATGDNQPWYRPGWFAEMSSWIDAQLADAGIRRRGPIRQVRSWARSALVDLETDHGRMWAKDVPEVFAHEVRVTDLLADVDPGLVPPLIAADAVLGRLVMEHVEGCHCRRCATSRPPGRRRSAGSPRRSGSSPRTWRRSSWPASQRRR